MKVKTIYDLVELAEKYTENAKGWATVEITPFCVAVGPTARICFWEYFRITKRTAIDHVIEADFKAGWEDILYDRFVKQLQEWGHEWAI